MAERSRPKPARIPKEYYARWSLSTERPEEGVRLLEQVMNGKQVDVSKVVELGGEYGGVVWLEAGVRTSTGDEPHVILGLGNVSAYAGVDPWPPRRLYAVGVERDGKLAILALGEKEGRIVDALYMGDLKPDRKMLDEMLSLYREWRREGYTDALAEKLLKQRMFIGECSEKGCLLVRPVNEKTVEMSFIPYDLEPSMAKKPLVRKVVYVPAMESGLADTLYEIMEGEGYLDEVEMLEA